MAEATLCEIHYREPFIGYANAVANGADDAGDDHRWHDSTGNDAIECVECRLDQVAAQ